MAFSWRAALLIAAGFPLLYWYPVPLTVTLWTLAVATLCIIDALAALSPRSFSYTRTVNGPIRADETTTSVVTVDSPSPRGARIEVRDAWEPSLHPRPYSHQGKIAAGAPLRLTTVLSPERRGVREADYVSVRVWGPLGLGARQISISMPASLDVLPEFRSRQLLPSRLARLQEIEGQTAVILRGPGTEFDSLRDYVRGDDPRDIDWKASARSHALVVRTWQPERDRHVLIIVDTGRSSALLLGAPHADSDHSDPDVLDLGVAPRLDANIESALLLAGLTDRAGDHVHFAAIDRQVHARVSGAKGADLMHSLARAIQPLSATTQPMDWSLVESEVRRTLRQRSLVVVMTQVPARGMDPEMLETLQRIKRQHTVVVASAEDPTIEHLIAQRHNAEEIYISAAAGATAYQQRLGVMDVQNAGVTVVSVNAGLLAARTADTYIELKKQGRL